MEKIVIIDEDLNFLNELSSIIKDLNFQPILFQEPYEAFKFLEKNRPYLVITELFFNNIKENEVWENLKKFNLSNVLIISEKPSSIGTQIIREGAIDYFLKPIEKEQIRLIITKIKLQQKKQSPTFKEIITNNPKMKLVLKIVESAAKSNSTVLIRGESGVGKELVARMIHEKSLRKDKPFVAVNCAALPENLLESELFGHEKGSFTGAINTKPGKFEIANEGTILLDEITEMDFSLQAKLLRVLQEKEIDRIGGREPIKIDVRVVATTNRDIKEAIEEKKFREDLFYRLNVIPIFIPPLRERKDDIPLLAKYFIKKHCYLNKIPEKIITDDAIKKLLTYDWPGNVRELENIIERAVVISPEHTISSNFILFEHELEKLFTEELNQDVSEQVIENQSVTTEDTNKNLEIKVGTTIAEMEKKLILETLKQVESNRTLAAQLLGISVRTLRNKLNEYKKEGISI